MYGLIHIYEGDGKGKTSAGVGLSVRCAGSGQRVLYAQFLKTDTSSELEILEKIDGIDVEHCEKSFGFIFAMSEDKKTDARVFYNEYFDRIVKKVVEGDYRMVVFDEIVATYNFELVEKEKVLKFLKNKPEKLEVVMTGRDAKEELVELADYVSRIQKIKHPFDKGIRARIGIEM